MANDTDVKKLLLQVDASVELLRKNLSAGEQRVAQFERSVNSTMDKADGHFARLGGGLEKVNGHLATVRAAAAGLIAAGLTTMLVDATKRGLEFASSLGEQAQQLGVTTKDLQEYRYAASQVGIEQEAMDKALARLTRTMGQALTGGKSQAQVFDALGISLRNANGSVKTAGDLLPEVADALAKIPDPARRAAVETQLFGKAGQQLDTLLSGGSKAINEYRDAAHRLGLVISDDLINQADEAADRIGDLNQVLNARIATVVSENATAIYNLANAFASLSAKSIQLANNYPRATGVLAGAAIGARMGGPYGALAGGAAGFLGGSNLARAQADGDSNVAFRLGELNKARARLDELRQMGGRGIGSPTSGPMRAAVAETRRQIKLLEAARASQHKAQQDKAGPKGDGPDVDLGGGGGGGAGSKGTSGTDGTKRFNQEILQAAERIARADSDKATTAEQEAEYDRQQIEFKRREDLNQLANDQNYSKEQKERLRITIDEVADAELNRVERRKSQRVEREAADLAEEVYRVQAEALRDQLDLTDNTAERARIAEELVDLEFRHKRAVLDAIIASESATAADKARARIVRDGLGASQAAASARASRESESPGQRYLRGLSEEAENLGDAYEAAAVRGLGSLNDALATSVKNALGLHGILGDVIGDLAEIAIRQSIIGPLASALFGSAGGLLGGIFGGFRAAGGPVTGGTPYVVGEKGPELFVPSASGRIVANSAMGGGQQVSIPITINAPGATAETVAMIRREIGQAAPTIIMAARNVTAGALSRPKLS